MAIVNQSNFRNAAQTAIKKYREKGLLADALFWETTIEWYESMAGTFLDGFNQPINGAEGKRKIKLGKAAT